MEDSLSMSFHGVVIFVGDCDPASNGPFDGGDGAFVDDEEV